jgi:hypothetical protein
MTAGAAVSKIPHPRIEIRMSGGKGADKAGDVKDKTVKGAKKTGQKTKEVAESW